MFTRQEVLDWRCQCGAGFLNVRMKINEVMSVQILRVKGIAFQLKTCNSPPTDKNIILTLTNELPPSYKTFVIQFDVTPSNLITLNNVITHLRNKEACQEIGCKKPEPGNSPIPALSKPPCHKSQVMCYNFQKKEHYCHKGPDKTTSTVPSKLGPVTSAAYKF